MISPTMVNGFPVSETRWLFLAPRARITLPGDGGVLDLRGEQEWADFVDDMVTQIVEYRPIVAMAHDEEGPTHGHLCDATTISADDARAMGIPVDGRTSEILVARAWLDDGTRALYDAGRLGFMSPSFSIGQITDSSGRRFRYRLRELSIAPVPWIKHQPPAATMRALQLADKGEGMRLKEIMTKLREAIGTESIDREAIAAMADELDAEIASMAEDAEDEVEDAEAQVAPAGLPLSDRGIVGRLTMADRRAAAAEAIARTLRTRVEELERVAARRVAEDAVRSEVGHLAMSDDDRSALVALRLADENAYKATVALLGRRMAEPGQSRIAATGTESATRRFSLSDDAAVREAMPLARQWQDDQQASTGKRPSLGAALRAVGGV